MRRLVLVSFFILNSLLSFSQDFPSRVWHNGWLVTVNRDTLKGEIKYDQETNAVQVIKEGHQKIKTFGSKQIIYFEIFDLTTKNYRQFYSIPYKVNSDFRTPILFEVVYEGKTSLLSRERIVLKTESYNSSFYYSGPAITSETLVFTFYFAFDDGRILEFTGKKGEIYTLLDRHPEKLKQYIKSNKLDVSDIRDLVRVLAFYNNI